MLSIVPLHVLIFLFALIISTNTQEVEIPQGILRGDTLTNRDGGIFYSFKNVPYGKPPVGELRFKAPEPAEGWEGIRDAAQELPQCVQLMSYSGQPGDGQEDCLYLNIYTPEESVDNDVLKPVMVFLHGGGFLMGDASESFCAPQSLLTKDVVLVVPNYRLGIFGFLTLDDPNLGVTGNGGLKDQALALQWVKDNIEYFGGDPNNVLLFGSSAGAMSVHLHLLSPMSEGLFHKAISQAGVGISPMILRDFRNSGVVIAEQLGIQTQNWTEMLSAMQEVSTEDMILAELDLYGNSPPLAGLDIAPIVEIPSNTPTFLEREPMNIIRSGDFNQVPYMHGFTDGEGSLIFMAVDDDGESPLIPDLTKYIPMDLKIEPGSEAEENISQRLNDFYYDGKGSSRENITGDINLYTDWSFAFPHYRATIEQEKMTSTPIYLYHFTAVTELNEILAVDGQGSPHSSEALFILLSGTMVEEGSSTDIISRSLVELWTNFATYGNPTPVDFDYIWKPVEENQINYLLIGKEGSSPEVDVRKDNMQLWSDIYDDYYPN